MSHYRFLAAATLCSALVLQGACSRFIHDIQDVLGAMASGEPPHERPPSPPTPKPGMYVRPAADTVAVGDTVVFNYELVPPKGLVVPSSETVHWESSDTSIATFVNGWVVGKKVGVATISATADGVRGNATLTVRPKRNQEDDVRGS